MRRTGDIHIATDLGVPRSTAAGWLRADRGGVVSLDVVDMCEVDLQAEVVRLQHRVATLTAVVGLLLAVRRAVGFHLERTHVFDRAMRAVVLRAAERARRVLPASSVFRILGISTSRHAAWTRAEAGCAFDEYVACPRSVPNQLTADEVFTIREMVTDERYRHVPTGRLAILAQRLGKVFASPASWYRLVRDYGWRRPRNRLHPDSPSLGVRGSRPDEVWHIDTSIVRLTDGTKVWLHAVIDNFSRKILAWRVAERFEISSAVAVLREAVGRAVSGEDRPRVMVDGGVENFNGEVDELVVTGLLSRVRALIDVRFSNSMIETWWRTIKH